MKLYLHEGHIELVVSERNLLSMLSKLYWDDSARELHSDECYIVLGGEKVLLPRSEMTFVLKGERDEDHYKGRPPTYGGSTSYAGPMHPKTEEVLRRIQDGD